MKLPPIKKEDLTEIDCPICKDTKRKFLFKENGFQVWSCQNCSHIYVSPQPNEKFYKKYYGKSYTNEFDIPEEHEKHRENVFNKTIQAINHYTGHKGDLLDIGAGFGGFLKKAQSSGWNVHGLEFNQARYEMCRKSFPSLPNSNFKCSNIENAGYEDSSFDVVVLINVIEHVKNPIDICKRAFDMLKPGGCLIIRWPQFTFRNSLQSAPEHLHGYTGQSIRHLLINLNFYDLREYWAGIGDFTKDASIAKKIIAKSLNLLGLFIIKITFGKAQIPFLSRLILARKR